MSKKIKIILIIGIVLTTIILAFIINFIRLNINYSHNKMVEETFEIQGVKNKYVPQGLTYSSTYNVVLQTSYSGNKDVSRLYVIDFDSGKLIKTLDLLKEDGKSNTLHVGGITTYRDKVWITNDYEISEYNLKEIMETEKDSIRSQNDKSLANRGDFCAYSNNVLWIGDFYLKPFYKVPNDNPLLLGYNLNDDVDYNKPDFIISLPKMVQGLVITPDNKFILTRSFTYFINSDLVMYDNVLSKDNEYYKFKGNNIPYYKFNSKNKIKNVKIPPMAEGLFYKDGDLYILFESNSSKYSIATPKVKKVLKMSVDNLEK